MDDLAHGKRRAFARLLKALHEGDIVIVASLDRLGLSVEEILGRLKEIRAKGAILSSLKSLLETGKPLAIQMEPPRDMIDAIKKV